ncbi:hypothetical protein [Photobacterium atrarenae]|uniref:ATP-binding protein n=1 Tax=Photobacterium atrarenae TaxID=865757 RepID=A0ABY5GNY3_9GAMM|nr:hypothetical protein [Photobacterium atrarenae]UTV30841.1 hypothetical protein NNL38_20000 [Photobacterium atrarenae]
MDKVSIEDIKWWLVQLDSFEKTGSGNAPGFWKPFHFTTLAIEAKRAGKNLILPQERENYAARMGLWEAIGMQPPVKVNKNPACGRFVEARSVQHDVEVHPLSIEISEMFRGCVQNQSTLDSIQVLMSELLGNCCAHSSTDGVFGLVCGQSWPGGNLSQICIADCGMGIRNSLLGNEGLRDRLTQNNACQVATEYGVTGKPYGSHSGYGLTLANDLIKINSGCLIVVSGNECYINRDGVSESVTLDHAWSGTCVILEWNIDQPLDVELVYNSWPKPDSMDGEEYDELFT